MSAAKQAGNARQCNGWLTLALALALALAGCGGGGAYDDPQEDQDDRVWTTPSPCQAQPRPPGCA